MKNLKSVDDHIKNVKSHKLLLDRVILYVPLKTEESVHNIIIPENASHYHGPFIKATVLSVGPGLKDKNNNHIGMEVSPGNMVWVHKLSASSTVDINNYTYMLIRENEIIAVIEE